MPILTEDERIGTVLAGKYRVRAVLLVLGLALVIAGRRRRR